MRELLTRIAHYFQALRRVWPLRGAAFLFAAFLATLCWLVLAATFSGEPFGENAKDWLEPFAALLGGFGAFLIVIILIGERVQSVAVTASEYDLARGLATGYYFNLVRPLIETLRNKDHKLHRDAKNFGADRIVGLVIGIPKESSDFDARKHVELYDKLKGRAAKPYTIHEFRIDYSGRRPRPIFVKLAVATTGAAVIVDIPTTLAVIPELAEDIAKRSPGIAASSNDALVKAGTHAATISEREKFEKILDELLKKLLTDFQDVVLTTSAREQPPSVTLVNVVALSRMRRRMDDLVGY